MSHLIPRTCALVVLVAAASHASLAQAQTWTGFGSVQYIEAGWAQDTMAVTHSAPVVNPNGCSVTSAGYATDPTDPGRSLFHTVALAAFLNRKEVQLLISGCVFNKPRIIAVGVR
jgi:hypothetical protein